MQIRLSSATEQRLEQAAARLGEAPSDIAASAVDTYLEDLDDYTLAAEAWAELDPRSIEGLRAKALKDRPANLEHRTDEDQE